MGVLPSFAEGQIPIVMMWILADASKPGLMLGKPYMLTAYVLTM